MKVADRGASGAKGVQQVTDRLKKPHKIIAFDWDGTAVSSRNDSVTALKARLEPLLAIGVKCVIITGTNFDNVNRQFCREVDPRLRKELFACTNRGSEVFGFDGRGEVVLLHRRTATEMENRAMDGIAVEMKKELALRFGLETAVIANRLNRRKLDLIPVPEWSEPLKDHIGGLLEATEARLRQAGVEGGIRHVIDRVYEKARAAEVDLRITTDVKHIEFGLTDKSDSVRYVLASIAAEQGIRPEEILFAGDEFGPIGGFEGSDFKMVTPEADGATYVSVGKEPNGVPAGVVWLGGGTGGFQRLLEMQLTAWEGWLVSESRYEPAQAEHYAAIFTLGNGYLGSRGAAEESAGAVGIGIPEPGTPEAGASGTFIAGVFDQVPGQVPEIPVAPDWIGVQVYVAGERVDPKQGHILGYRRTLDMRRGTLERTVRWEDERGRVTSLRAVRFASVAASHVMATRVTVEPENYSADIRLVATLDGEVSNSGARHLEVLDKGLDRDLDKGQERDGNGIFLAARTLHSGMVIAEACRVRRLPRAGDDGADAEAGMGTGGSAGEAGEAAETAVCEFSGGIGWSVGFDAVAGQECGIEKVVSIYTSRDQGVADPVASATATASAAAREGFGVLLSRHVAAWARRWDDCDVVIEGDQFAQRAIRFAMFHLLQAVPSDDERVSIPAKALTGEGYKGHVFWDTEIFMLPFFTFTFPETARRLLRYRYLTLPGARLKAAENGYRGAMYAWESADSGEETTPKWSAPDPKTGKRTRILCGEQEQHISADVSYAVWQYWQATGDRDFWMSSGAEILLETARFWASRVESSSEQGRYEIRGVIGPDEFHENVDNNAFTNHMARWNIEKGLEVARLLMNEQPAAWEAVVRRVALTEDELAEWRAVADGLYTGRRDPRTGVIEQFEGFWDLAEIDLRSYGARARAVQAIVGYGELQRYRVIKQPDVVMLFYLIGDSMDARAKRANWDYYEPITAHGSSLGPAIHAVMAAEFGDLSAAYNYFLSAAHIDLSDSMGNSAHGIHAATQGGVWQAVVKGFGGLRVRGGELCLSPVLPEGWETFAFPVVWRGQRLRCSANRDGVTVSVATAPPKGGKAVEFYLYGKRVVAEPGKPVRAPLRSGVAEPTETAGTQEDGRRRGTGA